MATLREVAQAYEPKQVHNIAELEKVPVDADIKTNKGKGKDGEEFEYYFTTINGVDYRIPDSVIGMIKELMKKAPQLKHVAVLKQGSGMGTKYQVIPYGPTGLV